MSSEKVERLEDQLGMLIRNTCNVIGCKNCALKDFNHKYDGDKSYSCRSDQLMDAIYRAKENEGIK